MNKPSSFLFLSLSWAPGGMSTAVRSQRTPSPEARFLRTQSLACWDGGKCNWRQGGARVPGGFWSPLSSKFRWGLL